MLYIFGDNDFNFLKNSIVFLLYFLNFFEICFIVYLIDCMISWRNIMVLFF